MEKQQEMASKQAFQESLSKQIAINTASNLSDLRSDSHQEMRDERMREFITPIKSQPETYDLSRDDFTPFDTPSPFYETPGDASLALASDYSNRINRRLDLEEQEQINARNTQEHNKKQTRQEASQHLGHSQPAKRRVDIYTKILTRNYLDSVYLNTIDKAQAKDDIKKESERVEKQWKQRSTKI